MNLVGPCRPAGFSSAVLPSSLAAWKPAMPNGCTSWEPRQSIQEAAGVGRAGQRGAESGLRCKALSPPAKRRVVHKMLEAISNSA